MQIILKKKVYYINCKSKFVELNRKSKVNYIFYNSESTANSSLSSTAVS